MSKLSDDNLLDTPFWWVTCDTLAVTHLLTLFILLDTAHVLSPIVLSWSHAGFRRLMLDQPRRYIMPPCVVSLIGLIVGIIAWPQALAVYLIWNFWHFSMQNFGIFQLIKPNRINLPVAFGLTAAGFWFAPIATSVNHWIMDIGLSSRAIGVRWPLFLLGLLTLTPAVFLWNRAPWLWPQLTYSTLIARVTPSDDALISFRLALGLYHFMTSRLVWKLSDPQVRATIGRDLFRTQAA